MCFTKPSERKYFLAFLIGILAGVFSAIVKWGWEVPFPPRANNPVWPEGATDRAVPPNIFLEQIGLGDWVHVEQAGQVVNQGLTYVFSGFTMPLCTFIIHVGFSVVFAVLYCVIAEAWPRIKMWQGAVFGVGVYLFAHVIVMPLIAETPPLSQIPFDENLSEFFGHIVWLWAIEIVRRDIRNRITKQPDPELNTSCCSKK